MSRREAFLDRGVGETRGVVLLDGRPERLLIQRDGDAPALMVGARSVARVRSVEAAFNSVFLDMPDGAEAIAPLRTDAEKPVRGASVEVEIRGEARRGKLANAWLLGEGQGAPRLLNPAPSIEEELRQLSRADMVTMGDEARVVADEAEDEALAVVHALPGGGSLAIEPTRALTAIDVDTGERTGGDSKRVSRAANLAAITQAARLLRLKGLGGLVVIDLAGRGHDGTAILAAMRAAFSADNPGVAIGPVSRFGTLELTIPRRRQPVLERLLDESGRLSPLSAALRLARLIEREGRADPGGRLEARCGPLVAESFKSLQPALAERLGGRFTLSPQAGWPTDRLEVTAS
ncbi:ribonuclease E/G [Caulobacter sp. NIBR1757]|uniref:ribonuclease E/G n=1 Tax=Caulobacter sp. NIBR1757 TaxID=3016000 RepID=UPI0022F05568|nr:ribonuclease E/G [Caulobacter sp. NIBR1757]WGM39473.1 Ribonuclease E [Caulobacter sp. NIBR1757]